MRLSQRLVQRKSAADVTLPDFWSPSSPAIWSGSGGPDRERVGEDFESYVTGAYQSNGIVFACMLARQALFSEARFAWRRWKDGSPGALFGGTDLALLERPWPAGTTGELLARMIQDADLAGNSFVTTADNDGHLGRAAKGPSRRLTRLRPDYMTIVLGSHSGDLQAADTRVIGFRYTPRSGGPAVFLLPSEVAHFSPIPDPLFRFRGMSWLTPVLREIEADKSANVHKKNFFKKGARLSTVVSLDKDVQPAAFKEFVEAFNASHDGEDNAYKTLFLGGGASVTNNTADLKQLDFKVVQGAGETRIAAAAGMHPVIVGLSEGLSGSSLNTGNFEAAIRLTADKTMRPLWRTAAASLEPLIKESGREADVELWYDDREIAFLRDDTTDVAEIQTKQAATANSLTSAGYTPESVIEYLETGNLRALKHSGLYSVQLQAPGSTTPPAPKE